MGFNSIKVKSFFNKVELFTLRQSFVVSGQFWSYIYCRKPRNTLCFDSKVDLRSFKLGNRAFSSNPGARAINSWSILLKTPGSLFTSKNTPRA